MSCCRPLQKILNRYVNLKLHSDSGCRPSCGRIAIHRVHVVWLQIQLNMDSVHLFYCKEVCWLTGFYHKCSSTGIYLTMFMKLKVHMSPNRIASWLLYQFSLRIVIICMEHCMKDSVSLLSRSVNIIKNILLSFTNIFPRNPSIVQFFSFWSSRKSAWGSNFRYCSSFRSEMKQFCCHACIVLDSKSLYKLRINLC